MAFAAAAPIIGSVVSGLFGRRSAKKQNEMSMAMAREQMEFQERMSSTAHQREVKDLLAAGLNPILSGTGGAGSSSPGGAMPSIVGEEEMPGLGQAASSAVQARLMKQELVNAEKTWQLLEQQRRKTQNEADVTAEEAEIRRLQRTWADEFGKDRARAESAGAVSSAAVAAAAVPEAEAVARLWKDLGEGGEVAKGLGAAAPIVKLLMSIFGRK